MDYQQLRNTLALMKRDSELTIPHPTHNVNVIFNKEGMFSINVSDKATRKSNSISSSKSLKEITSNLMYYFIPKVGEVFQHINGNIYTVLAIANENSIRPEYPPSVVYKGPNDKVWVKSMDNFMYKMNRIK